MTTTGGISAGTVTMSGGTISGTAFDWYHGITTTPTLNTLASSIPAVISADEPPADQHGQPDLQRRSGDHARRRGLARQRTDC